MTTSNNLPHSRIGLLCTIYPILFLVISFSFLFLESRLWITIYTVLYVILFLGIFAVLGIAYADLEKPGSKKILNKIGIRLNIIVVVVLFVIPNMYILIK